MRFKLVPLILVAALALGACGDDEHGPAMMGASRGGPRGFGPPLSVAPPSGSTEVPVWASIVLRFGAPMATEHYVDLHVGDLAGPTVPLGCSWSGDRITLTCTPRQQLQPRTTYVIHLAGGTMGPGWPNPNGAHGMSFPFTTG